jgi:hypothetical protein
MKLPLKWNSRGKVEENENNEECIVRKLKKRLIEIEIVKNLQIVFMIMGLLKLI